MIQYEVFSANEWLYPDSEVSAEGRRSLSLATARGSYAACQILLTGVPEGASIGWSYVPSVVGNFSGSWTSSVELYQQLDALVNENTAPAYSTLPVGTPAPKSTRQAPFRVYDALKPLHGGSFDSRGATEALYACWPIPASAVPGTYDGELVFNVGGERVHVPISIEVFAAVVPQQETLSITNWFSLGNIASRHRLDMWSDAYWDMLREYGRAMRRGRQTHFLVGSSLTKVEKVGDNRYTFDFTRTEKLIRLFLDLGFTTIEGGHIAGRTDWEAPHFVLNYDKEIQATSPEGYAFLSQYLTAWHAFLEKHGWLERTVQHVADEPIESSGADYRILAGIVRKFMPGVPLIDAIIKPDLVGAVDIWVPTNNEYENHRDRFERWRELGDTLWFYTCWVPGSDYLNRFMDLPLLQTRYLHWGNYKYDLTGYLHWGLNYYFSDQDPFELTNPQLAPGVHSKRVPAGDTHIVYPGTEGPWLSMRFEAMRAGIEDYELLRILAGYDQALADEIADSCVTSFKEVNADPAAFAAAHRRLLEAVSARM